MQRRSLYWAVVVVVLASALIVGVVDRTVAISTWFYQRCSGCHSDDNTTCAGCHQHNGTLSASADQDAYFPMDPLMITLDSVGEGSGWVRGILYDHTGAIVDVVGGPTLTGDDGTGVPVTFPIFLEAFAPAEPGDYTYEAAWFGSNNSGTAHMDERVPVLIRVIPDIGGVDEWDTALATGELRIAAHPNPMNGVGTLRFAVGPQTAGASLQIVNASGRVVRDLGYRSASGQVQELSWDGCDAGGTPVPAGAYFATLSNSESNATERILVLR